MATPPEGLPSWSAPSLVARSGRQTPAASGRHRGAGRGARRATARTSHRLTGAPLLPGPATAVLLLVASGRRRWREASARRARAVAIRRAGPSRPGLRWTVLCLACAAGTALGSFLLAGPVTALTGHDLEIPAAAATGAQPTWLGSPGAMPPLQVPASESLAGFMAPSGSVPTAGAARASNASAADDVAPLQLPAAVPAASAAPAAPVAAAPRATSPAAPPAVVPLEPTEPVVTTPRRATPPSVTIPGTTAPVTTAPVTTAPVTTTPGTTTPGTTTPGTTTPTTQATTTPASGTGPTNSEVPSACITLPVGDLLTACVGRATQSGPATN